jgi:hypothetical protein
VQEQGDDRSCRLPTDSRSRRSCFDVPVVPQTLPQRRDVGAMARIGAVAEKAGAGQLSLLRPRAAHGAPNAMSDPNMNVRRLMPPLAC